MQKITPYLWFDDNAEDAVEFYSTIFKNSRIISIARYGKAGPSYEGNVMSIVFQLEDQEFIALNGGPQFTFNEAVSFFVSCKNQKEIDYYWDALTADGGEESMCGWLKDKFGVSWQVVPTALSQLISSPDQERSAQAIEAMLKMKKLDIKALEKAYNQ
ncbi:3-demethylubiquinone-9 3-methyltransferase [compost metagenome]